ncbi:hypothetical protein AB0M47_04145 [Hamadaea sp. NPDC051192]|uniref:hypothetical protein n=1 Tax=Hamadaea sp. NPDC051192 TaxID=3154940 RepID=UPI00343D2A93
MSLRVNPDSRFLDVDTEVTYSTQEEVLRLSFPCPDCGVAVTPNVMNAGHLNDMQRYLPGRRWRCRNGHGSPNSL